MIGGESDHPADRDTPVDLDPIGPGDTYLRTRNCILSKTLTFD